MKRHKFITKNQLNLRSYFFIAAVICLLLIIFTAIGNATSFLSITDLDGHIEINARLEQNLQKDVEEQQQRVLESVDSLTTYTEDTDIFMLGSGAVYDAVKNQLLMQKQNIAEISSADCSLEEGSLLIISIDTVSSSESAELKKMVGNGVNLLFLKLPDNVSSSVTLMQLMGINEISPEETFAGTRMSEEYCAGQWMEDNKEKVTAYYVKTGTNVKTYMCALPDNYADIDNNELPALIWRHRDGKGSGNVYVCNGDFMESENAYGIIPVVLQELRGSYIYPIVNAYCVFVQGIPYSGEEERDYWDRLYSRNASGILSDMLTSQIVRYSKVYGAKLSVFSREYELFSTTADSTLNYYTRVIESNQGILCLKTDSGDYIKSTDDSVAIRTWTTDYSLWDTETMKLNVPVNYVYDTTQTKDQPNIFKVSASSYGIGYYCVSIDYEDFLEYDEEYDIWEDFCKQLEVVLGTHERDEGWLDRVTVAEAANRMFRLLDMDVEYEYTDDGIELQIENFDEAAWFILRDSHEEFLCRGCTVENIGTDCYLVSVNEQTASITWRD